MANITTNLSLPKDFLGIVPFRQAIARAFDLIDVAVGKVLTGSKTHDFADTADGAAATTTVTVTGAALGDFVTGVSVGVDLAGGILTGYVSAADTVTVRLQNESGSSLNLASTTLRVLVRKA